MKRLCIYAAAAVALMTSAAGLASASTMTYLISASQLESALVGNSALSGAGCSDSNTGNVLTNCGIWQIELTSNSGGYTETAVVSPQATGNGDWTTTSVSGNPAMQADPNNSKINFISQNTGVNGVSYGTEFGNVTQTGLGVFGASTELGFTFSSSGTFAATDNLTLDVFGAIFQSGTNGTLSTGTKTFELTGVVVTATATPEPSSSVLLFGAMACLALLARPRRSAR